MASLLPGFEYDIFISYRHNDNRSGWVTEFVRALQEELAATIKDPVSVYFDTNPHDGLLETHDVNKSLEGKLKCLIFIPIISQTYCDPKSFAWQNEFCAFNKLAKEDSVGKDIRLGSGNVASRILPIKIHDLDTEDKALLEDELGGVLRAIEFIYKEAGVNRPLKVDDHEASNLNGTRYRNQINKVANAVKELTLGIQQKGLTHKPATEAKVNGIKPSARKKITLVASILVLLGISSFVYYYFGGVGSRLHDAPDRSIAVLPFENMNHDPDQDYFSNGIAEDILNHLTKISDLKVKSRTSTLQYKGTSKSITEIGQELSVGNLVEGSVRRVGDQVRIVVQLIDAKTDVHLWSETYDRELKDVLSLQSQIAIEIARALEARLTSDETKTIKKEVSQNVTAYDYFLKARETINRSNGIKRDIEDAMQLVNEALSLDPGFSKANSLKGRLWFIRGWQGASQKTWYDSAVFFAAKSITLDPSSPDGHLVLGDVYRKLGKLKQAKSEYHAAYTSAPNDPGVLTAYGSQLLREGNEKGADMVLESIQNQYSFKDPEYYLSLSRAYYFTGNMANQEQLAKKSKALSPGSIGPYLELADVYAMNKEFDKAIQELKTAESINPEHQNIIDNLAWTYYLNNDLENAVRYWSKYKEIESRFEDPTQTVPFRARLAMAYAKMGRKKEADRLIAEDLEIRKDLLAGKRSMGTWGGIGTVFYDMSLDLSYMGKDAEAVQCLDSALKYNFSGAVRGWLYKDDSMLTRLRGRSDFQAVIRKEQLVEDSYKRAFNSAFNRMEASRELKNSLK